MELRDLPGQFARPCARESVSSRSQDCDGPADACETVATVNVAMFDATGVESDSGVRILGGRAFS